jgi:hypothetical protein
MNKLITLGQTITNNLMLLNFQSITQVLPRQLLSVLMMTMLKRQQLLSAQRRNLLLRAIETSS